MAAAGRRELSRNLQKAPRTSFRADKRASESEARLIPTAYKGTENHCIASGYTAYILDKTGEHAGETLEQRTRLRGYEQIMTNRIRASIRDAIMGNPADLNKETGLNYVYHHLHSSKLPFDFEQEQLRLGRDSETINALVKTQLSRV